jgi:phosphatidylinositol glycan class Q protein
LNTAASSEPLLLQNVSINWVQWALGWLDSWPAGLKLNTELSRFYSHSFIDLIIIWGGMSSSSSLSLGLLILFTGLQMHCEKVYHTFHL